MNIEESIEYLKNYKYDNEVKQSIEILLTSYEKEKEKNRKYLVNLTHEQYIKLVEQIRSETNKEWKDKIKAKIEEVEQWELYNMKIPRLSTLDERLGAKIGIKYVLQSLLEKE